MRRDTFVVATHVQPDGDAIGSLLGTAFLLEKLGKRVWIAWDRASAVPSYYRFLPGARRLRAARLPARYSALITLDAATEERLGDSGTLTDRADLVINLDHHPDNTFFGHINLVSDGAAATAEIVLRLSRRLPIELDRDIATCLYVGLVTDTGRFQYGSTTPQTHRFAGELLRHGVDPAAVFRQVYEAFSLAALELLCHVISRVKYLDGPKLIYSFLTRADLRATGVGIEETENFIDFLRAVRDANVAALFKEAENGEYRVSLRSKQNVDVGAIARVYGGGGHPNAAGFTSKDGISKTATELARLIRRACTGPNAGRPASQVTGGKTSAAGSERG